jgi:serine/threonine protein kinase
MARDPERLARFQREARAVAALNHPNIVTLYSVEEADGVPFLTMELLEGQPLDRCIPEGGLPIERIVEIGSALAEALAAAHEKGIMHRHLKPANVMVTNDGRVKVLDFGLAKETHANPDDATLASALTQAGAVMGTLAYMSPEQTSGRVLDHRTDIFSLGVVLHKMATGRRPFEGTSSAELVSSILRDSPSLVTDLRPDLPSDLARVIRRCLEKDLRHRVQTAYLKAIARSSTLRYAHGEADVRVIGREPGARYVMEGSLRQAGAKLRLAVQLADASSGAHVWAETYDRTFRPDDIFSLQDDLVPRIVSTVADTYGVLPRSMSEALRNRDPEQLTPYQSVLRSFAHFPRLSAEEHAAARAGLERAVQQSPDYADGWAMLSMLYREEYTHGFNTRPDPIGRAFAAARRVVEAAPSNHLAYYALASAQFFRRELQDFRNSAERAIALNPMDGFTAAYLGFLIAYAGDWERGCDLVERARGLNSHHPGWYWFPSFFDAYRKGDCRAALDFALEVNMPAFWRTNLALATAKGQLGERQAARNAVRELLALRPDFPTVAREELGKWWDPELVGHLIDGLRKAGLEIAEEDGAQ